MVEARKNPYNKKDNYAALATANKYVKWLTVPSVNQLHKAFVSDISHIYFAFCKIL